MTTSQVASFIATKQSSCSVAICLTNFSENGKSSAQIISDAATLYGINPQVLLIIMQVQTGLVSATSPSSTLFANAMGQPNTLGFTNQVNAAAQQLSTNMALGDGTFQSGIPQDVPYNIAPACGSAVINFQNEATAALYSYPSLAYQPNAASLAADLGAGDSCSTYGIRNFYIYYNMWFGNLVIYTPVYRFWSAASKHHFYTTSSAEKDYIRQSFTDSQWHYEGAVASTPETTTANSCSNTNSVPIYRFWSAINGGHFYTISAAERDYVQSAYTDKQWRYEGVGFCAYQTAGTQQERTPVYRFWSSINNSHFYTADAAEADYVKAAFTDAEWHYEGIAYYVYGTAMP